MGLVIKAHNVWRVSGSLQSYNALQMPTYEVFAHNGVFCYTFTENCNQLAACDTLRSAINSVFVEKRSSNNACMVD